MALPLDGYFVIGMVATVVDYIARKIREGRLKDEEIIFIPIKPTICLPIRDDMLVISTLSWTRNLKGKLDVSVFANPVIKDISPMRYNIKLSSLEREIVERIYQSLLNRLG